MTNWHEWYIQEITGESLEQLAEQCPITYQDCNGVTVHLGIDCSGMT